MYNFSEGLIIISQSPEYLLSHYLDSTLLGRFTSAELIKLCDQRIEHYSNVKNYDFSVGFLAKAGINIKVHPQKSVIQNWLLLKKQIEEGIIKPSKTIIALDFEHTLHSELMYAASMGYTRILTQTADALKVAPLEMRYRLEKVMAFNHLTY